MKSLTSFKNKLSFASSFYLGMVFFSLLVLFCLLSFFQLHKTYILFFPVLLLAFPLILLYPQALLYLFFLSFYWGFFLWADGYVYLSWSHLFFIAVILGFSSKYLFSGKKSPLVSSTPPLSLFLFFFVSVASFLLNVAKHEPGEQMVSLSYLFNFALILIAYYFFSSPELKQWKNKIILFILILSVLEIPVVVLQVMKIGANYLASYRDITGTFGAHHSMMANMMTFPLGFSLAKLLEKPKIKTILWLTALALASLYAIVYSGSRSNLIGIAGAFVILTILKLRLKPICFLYFFIFSAGVFFLLKFSPIRHLVAGTIHSADTGTLDLSSLGRVIIWKFCWNYYINSEILVKLFGIGISNLTNLAYSEILFNSKVFSGAHNIFLHVLLETGLVGFLLFMAYYIGILIKLFRQSKNDPLALAYLFITLSLLLSGFTQEIFWFQPVFGCLWLYHTCLLALILDHKKATSLQTHP